MTEEELKELAHKLSDQLHKAQNYAELTELELRRLAQDAKDSAERWREYAIVWERFAARLSEDKVEKEIDKEIHGKQCGCI